MNLARAITLGIGVCLASLSAQECPPVALVPPNGTLAGALDAASCQLGDRTPYSPYRLDLPVRGQLKIALSGGTPDLSVILRDASGSKVDAGASLVRALEAGRYTLLVNGSAPGLTGSFTLNAAFTAEPAILCANFLNVGAGQTVAGRLPGSGCLALDGTPYEAYTLTTSGAGTLTVSANSQDFTPVVAVRSIDGHPLTAPSPSPVDVVLAADSQYQVIVSSADAGTGAFQIANTFQPADGETCLPQKTLANPDRDANAITAASCYVTPAGSGDLTYYNYYDLTLTAAGLVSASAVSGDFTATLTLLDAAGNTLASGSNLRAQLPAGSYRLRIASDLPSGGNYTLQYNFQAGTSLPCTSRAILPGDQLSGVLSDASCRAAIGLSDEYTLTLASAGTLDLEIASQAFGAILAIRDGKDNLLVRADAAGGPNAHITADLPPGVYTVVGAATSGAGTYLLTARFTAHDIPPCTFVQSLDLNGGFIQRLGPRSCIGANGQPVDYYTFTLPADALVLAIVTSSEVDGYLTLYDANGSVLRNDDNTYGSNDPLIVQYRAAGTYNLAVRGASATSGGLYQVDLRTVAGPRPPLCTPVATVTPGSTVTGVLTYTACQYTDNTFADLYRMNLAADATVDLQLASSEFNAYLVLLDSSGAVIDEDDDSGGGSNARVTRDLPAGTYFLVVKPTGDYLSHGAYTLVTQI